MSRQISKESRRKSTYSSGYDLGGTPGRGDARHFVRDMDLLPTLPDDDNLDFNMPDDLPRHSRASSKLPDGSRNRGGSKQLAVGGHLEQPLRYASDGVWSRSSSKQPAGEGSRRPSKLSSHRDSGDTEMGFTASGMRNYGDLAQQPAPSTRSESKLSRHASKNVHVRFT